MNKYLPTMYKRDSNGRIRVRESVIQGTENKATWSVTTGIQGMKMTVKDTHFKEGKQGRTAFEQAVSVAESKHSDKQRSEKYVENIEDIDKTVELLVPMTAKLVGDAKNLTFPYIMQQKLDGNRCMIRIKTDGTITKWSRKGNVFDNLEHLDEKLTKFGEAFFSIYGDSDIVLDGELFTWDLRFEEINGALKSPRVNLEGLTPAKLEKAEERIRKQKLIQFYCFDAVSDMNTTDRFIILSTIWNNTFNITADTDEIKLIPNTIVTNQKEADDYHAQCVADGFEGSMIRKLTGLYEHKKSSDLFKRKDFFDNEYLIIDIISMDKAPLQGKYVCETPEGKVFDVTPKCSHPEREEILTNKKDYIGKQLTVRYNEIMKGKPRFGRGIRIRDES